MVLRKGSAPFVASSVLGAAAALHHVRNRIGEVAASTHDASADPSSRPEASGLSTGTARMVDPYGGVIDVDVRLFGGRSLLEAGGLAVTVGDPTRLQAGTNLQIEVGRTIEVDGSGFLPGSRVQVVLHSTPTLLADVAAGADGTFRVVVDTPALPAGEHTIVVSGTRSDGERRAVSLGVELLDAQDVLAFTGSTPMPRLLAALGLFGLGVLLVVWSRRPTAA